MKKDKKNLDKIEYKNPKSDLKEKNKDRKRKKARLIISFLILCIAIIYIIAVVYSLIKNPTNTFIVNNGELSKEETVDGYIIREETVIEGQNYKNGMTRIKEEGERVAKGDSVFRYYSNEEEGLKEKISKLDVQIQEILENENIAFSADEKLLETQIETQLNELYKQNETQKIKEYKKNINTYITKKAKIVGDLSPSGSYLNKLISERSTYENQLNTNSEYINAPVSGLVSYRVDGLETVLTPNDFGNLNKKILQDLNIKTGQIIASNEEIGKIIGNYSAYIVFNSATEEAKKAKINDQISIRILNNEIIKAKIINIIEESDGSRTVAVQVNKQIENLITYRKISFDIIWWNASGYRVPNSAIKEKDGIKYVIRNRNGYHNKMAVKILKQSDEYCIVETCSRNELLELGLTSTEISDLKTITLYDEIILNPLDE